MTAYIGKPGGLLALKGASEISIGRASRSNRVSTLLGRVVEFRGPRGNRSWDLSVSTARPEEYAELQQLAAGAFGAPPYVWLDEYAQVTNLMVPAVSILEPGSYSESISQGGSGVTADGTRFGYSILPAGASVGLDGSPVVQGVPVTASVYCTDGRVRLDWLDAVGNPTAGPISVVSAGVMGRVSITGTPPVSAVRCRLVVTGSSRAALPASTFTAAAMPWAMGRGCEKASISEVPEQVQMAVPEEQFRRAGYQFTVREIG